MNKMLAMGILIPVLILTTPNVYARNLSDTQRYNDGYSNGVQAAATDSTYNPTCDPTGAYTSGGGHTPTYCSGWANGYTATWNANHVVRQAAPASPFPITNTNNQSVGQSATTSGSSQWQEFGVFVGPIQKHTGVFHNENGVFIPWTTLCGAGQSYLLESCGSLINPGGSLNSAGDTAVGCITNGAIISALAASFNLPLATIKGFLVPLAGLTGCGGIVDMNQIQNSPDVQRLLQIAGTLAR
jgi:hypothetical protein